MKPLATRATAATINFLHLACGAADRIGYHAVEDRMYIHDLPATVHHPPECTPAMSLDRHTGRAFRLANFQGAVARKTIA